MDITVTNVNQALSEALHYLADGGVEENSRNGPVIVSKEPVLITYTRPWERVLFSPMRDANPFFHMMESLWMLAGRNDLEWPMYFNKNFASYSDDGKTVHGAYGYRWRKAMGFDQLYMIAEELKSNPESRRCVLQMWDATNRYRVADMVDLHTAFNGGKDVPCNTHIYFDCRGGKLNMTVCNRSNDLIWGLAGANAVHFSVLQEYLATWINKPIGEYRQFSNNLHAYTAVAGTRLQMRGLATDADVNDYYKAQLQPAPTVTGSIADWDEDLKLFFEDPARKLGDYQNKFFTQVAGPMYGAWTSRKNFRTEVEQLAWVDLIAAPDWHRACKEWMLRRIQKAQAKKERAVG